MAKILTIEADDVGVLLYRLHKPALRKLEAAQSVLASLKIAVPRPEDNEKVTVAHEAIIRVIGLFPDTTPNGDSEAAEQEHAIEPTETTAPKRRRVQYPASEE